MSDDSNRPGIPESSPIPRPITVDELDRLQAIYDASSQTQVGYCSAGGEGCSCQMIFMDRELAYSTHRIEDQRPDGTIKLDSPGISKADLICFAEAKNALPELIRLARIALTREK